MKRRHKRLLINLVAFSALAFAIYFSFFQKDPAVHLPGSAQVAKH